MDDVPVEELVRDVLAGEEEAARRLFRSLYPTVLWIVRNHRPIRHSEEDLCQMIFLKVFTKLGQYSARTPLSHWVSRIAVNTCLTELKKERIRPEIRESDLDENAGAVAACAIDPEAPVEDAGRSAREIVDLLLARLAPADRLVVSLLYLEGRSLAEIGAVTGLSRIAVKVRAFRARQKLHHALRLLLKGDSL